MTMAFNIDFYPDAIKIKLNKPAYLKGGQVVRSVFVVQVAYCMIDVYLTSKNYNRGKTFDRWYLNKVMANSVNAYFKKAREASTAQSAIQHIAMDGFITQDIRAKVTLFGLFKRK